MDETSRMRPDSLIHPGVREANAAALEVRGVAGGKHRSVHVSYRANLRIELSHGATLGATTGCDARESVGCLFFEWQDAAGENLAEHSLRPGQQCTATLALREDFDSIKNLSQGDSGGVKGVQRLGRHPTQ